VRELRLHRLITKCPGFGQDRVNFHQKPGGDTAGRADPNWPNKWGIRYHVPSRWGLSGGAGRGRVIAALEYTGHW